MIDSPPTPPVDRSGTPLVEMRDISVSFGGIKAVDHVTVDLYPGEVVGLLGHNGAGKSTLIKVMSGVVAPDEGRMFLDGQQVSFEVVQGPKGPAAENVTPL